MLIDFAKSKSRGKEPEIPVKEEESDNAFVRDVQEVVETDSVDEEEDDEVIGASQVDAFVSRYP